MALVEESGWVSTRKVGLGWLMRIASALFTVSNDELTGTLEQHLLGALGEITPRDVALATAYLTPEGFLSLKSVLAPARRVRVLLGERPFLSRRGPSDRLRQPTDDED